MNHSIVIVEDEEIIREGLKKSYSWEKHNIRVVGTFSNGKELLDVYDTINPDIILLDVNMPIMGGIEFLQNLDDELVSVIILSGYNEFEYAQAAIRYRVVDYLLKPLKFQKLEKALIKAIDELEMKKIYAREKDSSKLFPINVLPEPKKIDSLSLKKSLEYIEENYSKKVTLEDLTMYVDRSNTHINALFNETFNVTSMEYLSRYRIQKSIELISKLKYYLYEIAEKVGFDDYKYFSQVFKKFVGQTPQEVENYFMEMLDTEYQK